MVENKKFQAAYLIGTVIIWVAIIFASALTLSGTPYFAHMLPILGGGVFWFVVLVPGAFFWTRTKPKQPLSASEGRGIADSQQPGHHYERSNI